MQFNLDLEEHEVLKDQLKFWKDHVTSTAQAPPLIIDILLDVSKLTPSETLVFCSKKTRAKTMVSPDLLMGLDSQGRPVKRTRILMETWQLSLSYHYLTQSSDSESISKDTNCLQKLCHFLSLIV